jgi:hypothetical protein
MTTRTHYRNSTLAFPKTAEYGAAITRYATPARADTCVMYACALGFVVVAVLLILEVL